MLTPYFFDLLHLDGADLIDLPGRERWAALAGALDPTLLVGRMEVDGPEQAGAAFAAAIEAGQEGVVVKDPAAPYDAGRRGSAWVKVKPRHTLDLVVLAVEWGSGRRQGWLSNLHLGARDPRTGEFVMLGKTFKGLTDELLRWQTERFLDLAVEKGDWVVRVRPEQVVEIAFDGVQTQHAATRAGGAAVRPRGAVPRRQVRRRGRHHRRGPGHPRRPGHRLSGSPTGQADALGAGSAARSAGGRGLSEPGRPARLPAGDPAVADELMAAKSHHCTT